ncbi:MurR/RpiR family transcriptional regulator [Sedimentitalea sp. XS_ASV28]|uniref:MurR/RpiR family transcriptional regulator n=1 Tax=Sedimentitalea sp. XS_ASV28 TaxID=3241296 RepID=UPI0035120411
MADGRSITDLVSARYGELTEGLQQAADYVVANPIDVATQSLRSVAASSGMSPTTFSRLSRALGLRNHDEVRALCRVALTTPRASFADKARDLQCETLGADGPGALFVQQAEANLRNISELVNSINMQKTVRVVEKLAGARRVWLLAGAMSQALARYLDEMAVWITDNWRLVADDGTSMSRAVSTATADDVVILISKSLFTAAPIRAAELAAGRGAHVVLITDSHTCPALAFASDYFVLPADSPHFFPSYAPAVVLLEAMMSMLAAHLGDAAEERIKQTEAIRRDLGVYWE